MLNSVAGHSQARVSKPCTVDSWACYGRAFLLVYSKDNIHFPAWSFKYYTGAIRLQTKEQQARLYTKCTMLRCLQIFHPPVHPMLWYDADACYVRLE